MSHCDKIILRHAREVTVINSNSAAGNSGVGKGDANKGFLLCKIAGNEKPHGM